VCTDTETYMPMHTGNSHTHTHTHTHNLTHTLECRLARDLEMLPQHGTQPERGGGNKRGDRPSLYGYSDAIMYPHTDVIPYQHTLQANSSMLIYIFIYIDTGLVIDIYLYIYRYGSSDTYT